MGDFDAAVTVARDMDEQVKRLIHEQQARVSATDADDTEQNVEGGGSQREIDANDPEVEEEVAELDSEYEASVWAKVTLADLTTRTIREGHDDTRTNQTEDRKEPWQYGGSDGGPAGLKVCGH